MRIGIVSDIHANLAALETVLRVLKTKSIDRYVCLGDVVGYGASPNECCDLIKDLCDLTIIGNHDAAVSGKMDYSYYYDQAKQALDWTVEVLREENLAWLSTLPYLKNEADIDVCFSHGAPIHPEEFNYIFNMEQARDAYQHHDELLQVTFIGHSHLCRVFAYDGSDVIQMIPGLIELDPVKKYIISIGSVGQPRDYDPRAAYAIFDTESRTFEQHRVEYDISLSARRAFEVRLPDAFGKRLFVGI
jgi:diadenosine tetraphosphatase ApaH/serine/threonine PP2A family protein phosphatase